MSSKVSILWAICAIVDSALPPARWLLSLASLSLPALPDSWQLPLAKSAALGWTVAFLLDRLLGRLVQVLPLR